MKKVLPWSLSAALAVVVTIAAGNTSDGSSQEPTPCQQQGVALSLAAMATGADYSTTARWPSEIPPDVPKFTYGRITSFAGNRCYMQVRIADPTADCFDNYQRDLKKAGWEIVAASHSANPENIMIMAHNRTSSIHLQLFPNDKKPKQLIGSIVYSSNP